MYLSHRIIFKSIKYESTKCKHIYGQNSLIAPLKLESLTLTTSIIFSTRKLLKLSK